MANYDPDKPGVAGLQPVSHAAAAGDSFSNNGKTLIRVNNGGGAPITLTVDDPGSTSPVAATAFNPDAAIVVTNGQARIIGPFPAARFNDANGRCQLAWSATTSVTWEAYTTE
jgi:hypothetical protein